VTLRELTEEERTLLSKADPYVFYRCNTELLGQLAIPQYRPVLDESVDHEDIRHRVRYVRGELQ